jgi:large subunit ribosomal protein L10
MATEKKAELINELTEKLQRSKAAVLVQTQGLTVAEITDLRRRLGASAGELKVAKNTLLRIASERMQIDDLADVLQGPTTIALSYADEVGIAKAITDYVRTSRVVTIKAGILGRRRLTPAQVESLARTPARPQLQGQVFGALQAPVSTMANLLSAPLRDLAYVLQARADQLSGGAEAAAEA